MRAFFELRAREPHDWNRLFKEVSRDRRAVLRHWHLEGLGILSRLRAQEAAGPEVPLPSFLSRRSVPDAGAEDAEPDSGLTQHQPQDDGRGRRTRQKRPMPPQFPAEIFAPRQGLPPAPEGVALRFLVGPISPPAHAGTLGILEN